MKNKTKQITFLFVSRAKSEGSPVKVKNKMFYLAIHLKHSFPDDFTIIQLRHTCLILNIPKFIRCAKTKESFDLANSAASSNLKRLQNKPTSFKIQVVLYNKTWSFSS